jgi:quercetin dioxygenase-like cupin family protein
MEAEGYIVSEHIEPPGTVHEPHDHSTDQSLWIISGSAQLRIGDELYTLNAGDRDYLPAHTEHSALAIGEKMVVYLNGVKK